MDRNSQSSSRDGYHRLDVFSRHVDMGCYEYLPKGFMGRIR